VVIRFCRFGVLGALGERLVVFFYSGSPDETEILLAANPSRASTCARLENFAPEFF
jgi:hypothetical protein